MKPAWILAMSVCVGMADAQTAPAPASAAVSGAWWTPGFNARVRVAPCGDALCGHIVWVS